MTQLRLLRPHIPAYLRRQMIISLHGVSPPGINYSHLGAFYKSPNKSDKSMDPVRIDIHLSSAELVYGGPLLL